MKDRDVRGPVVRGGAVKKVMRMNVVIIPAILRPVARQIMDANGRVRMIFVVIKERRPIAMELTPIAVQTQIIKNAAKVEAICGLQP